MPTGVHLQDAREQLFEAGERVLLRDGPSGLTSRAVTDEAKCAKGVLHRHFVDFDGYLVELVLDRANRLDVQAETLRTLAGTGVVTENLARALTDLFGPIPRAIVPLVTFRDELRARLRDALPGGGIAILKPITRGVSAYLTQEKELGRIVVDADIDSLTLSLVGGGHLLFTDSDTVSPRPPAVEGFVQTVLAAVLTQADR